MVLSSSFCYSISQNFSINPIDNELIDYLLEAFTKNSSFLTPISRIPISSLALVTTSIHTFIIKKYTNKKIKRATRLELEFFF